MAIEKPLRLEAANAGPVVVDVVVAAVRAKL